MRSTCPREACTSGFSSSVSTAKKGPLQPSSRFSYAAGSKLHKYPPNVWAQCDTLSLIHKEVESLRKTLFGADIVDVFGKFSKITHDVHGHIYFHHSKQDTKEQKTSKVSEEESNYEVLVNMKTLEKR